MPKYIVLHKSLLVKKILIVSELKRVHIALENTGKK